MKASNPKRTKLVFWLCLITSIVLIVWGFILPPMGEIDGSVLTAVGELFGFATLAVGYQALNEGLSTRISKGNVSIEVSKTE